MFYIACHKCDKCIFILYILMNLQENKAIVYIDALNLYYGLLRGTPYKWLDVFAFAQKELANKGVSISEIKFFYARVSWNEKDLEAPLRQQTYIKALDKHVSKFCKFTCIEWYFKNNVEKKWLIKWKTDNQIVTVLTNEEKGTDVNLWVHMVYDSLTNKDFDIVCLISNDTDLWEALRLVQLSWKMVYLIPTVKKLSKWELKIKERNWERIARVAGKLTKYAKRFCPYISKWKLESCQLPTPCEWIEKINSW